MIMSCFFGVKTSARQIGSGLEPVRRCHVFHRKQTLYQQVIKDFLPCIVGSGGISCVRSAAGTEVGVGYLRDVESRSIHGPKLLGSE